MWLLLSSIVQLIYFHFTRKLIFFIRLTPQKSIPFRTPKDFTHEIIYDHTTFPAGKKDTSVKLIDLKKAKCRASTTYSDLFKCNYAFDGTLFRNYASRYQGVGLWIEVTFPKKFFVAQVELLNRVYQSKACMD